MFFQPVNQAYGAMVADEELLRQMADGWAGVVVHRLDGQKHLILLRFQTFGPGSLFAEVEEFPNLITEVRQGPIVDCSFAH